ncbi:3-oxoacyl-ACP synthase III family protein [Nitrococcus mobilis]|nr:ketoacyl-ACP synthase III [Nitrococcus mobilis]
MARIANLIATGRYIPAHRVTNEALQARFAALGRAESIVKLAASSGIRQRWYAPDDWATSDLILPAARQALERAGRSPEAVDLIIVGTDSPDYLTPATATVVQAKLGAFRAGTFDIGCACASFPTALAVAAGLLATNPGLRTILVTGAYLMHRLADPEDPLIFLYGDGAGAAVVEPGDEPGFLGSAFRADGRYAQHWGIYAGGTAEPASQAAVRAGRTRVRLHERYPPEINHEGWIALVRTLATQCGFRIQDVAQAIFTQINQRTIWDVCGALGLPVTRAHTIMDKWGYTGSACLPMALDDAIEQGLIRPGDLVMMVGSGVGYNLAGVALRITEQLMAPQPPRAGQTQGQQNL